MKQQICFNCGARLKKGAGFCSRCGHGSDPAPPSGEPDEPAPPSAEAPVPERDGSNWGCLFYLVCLILFPVGIGYGAHLLRKQTDAQSRQNGRFHLALGLILPAATIVLWLVMALSGFRAPEHLRCAEIVGRIVVAEREYKEIYGRYTTSMEALEGLLGARLPVEEYCVRFELTGPAHEPGLEDHEPEPWFEALAVPRHAQGSGCRILGDPSGVSIDGRCGPTRDRPEWLEDLLRKETPEDRSPPAEVGD